MPPTFPVQLNTSAAITRPLVLSIGLADPVSAFGIQADLSSFSTLHCHGVSVPTALISGDTATIEEVVALEQSLVAPTARLLLEDLPIAAIKIGIPAALDNLEALAELISDYNHLPLVLDPFCSFLPESGSASDDIIIGMRDLLIPQATILLISRRELEILAHTWRDAAAANAHAEDQLQADAQWLIDHGCEYVLVSGTDDAHAPAGSVGNTLFGEAGKLRHDCWPRLPGQFLGAGACLAAAITALLAHDIPVPNAVLQAQLYCANALAHARRLGMGKLIPARHLLPDSMFEPMQVIGETAEDLDATP